MAVPAVITDLLVAVADNVPKGTDAVTTSTGPDEFFRAHAAIVRRLHAKGADVASAATVDLGAINDGSYVKITGTTTITSFGTIAAGVERTLLFADALTLTHDAAKIILPGAANIVTVAEDVAVFVSEGAGLWRCKSYQRKAVPPSVPLDASVVTAKIADGAVTTVKVADDAVTYAKIQNVSATDKLLGRATAGAGDVEEITCTPFARTVLDDADALTAKRTLLSEIPLKELTATVASDALTLGAVTTSLNFRSATLGSGAIAELVATPANIVVPSGATLGTVDAKKNRLIVGVMNVAGVAELFVMNAILGNYLDESQRITTVVLDAASDSAEVAYSTTARADMPFRILGYVESTQATAGVWATAPTLIQGFGAGAEIVQQASFRAHQDAGQSIAEATMTKVLFQVENYDIGANFASSAFTAPAPGIYRFTSAVSAILVDGQRAILLIYVNGGAHSRIFDFNTGAASDGSASGSCDVRLRAGDVVEAFIYYSVAETTTPGDTLTFFSGHRIG